jgi:hypothetical protein
MGSQRWLRELAPGGGISCDDGWSPRLKPCRSSAMDLGLEASLLEDAVASLRSEILARVGLRLLVFQDAWSWALAEPQSVGRSRGLAIAEVVTGALLSTCCWFDHCV